MRRGLLLGKFLPPHAGHAYLVDFARHHPSVDEVAVLVCSLPDDPVDGRLRERWMAETFAGDPRIQVIGHHVPIPQTPEEHPRFWEIWRDAITSAVGEVDVVFASESYGHHLASTLGAVYIPVDPPRAAKPVAATQLRDDPIGNFHLLVTAARPHYVRRLVVAGAESTGKSTLCAELAVRRSTAWVPEYGRVLCESRRDPHADALDAADLVAIVHGQLASEDALARQANRLLICDTDAVITAVWARHLIGGVPDEVESAARASEGRYDATVVLDTDVPFVDDTTRTLGRRLFTTANVVDAYRRYGREVEMIGGPFPQRADAVDAVAERLLAPASGSGEPAGTVTLGEEHHEGS